MKETMTIKDVFSIAEREGDQKRWTRVGVGFVNRDNSVNVVLDALPINGRLHIRDREARSQKENEKGETR